MSETITMVQEPTRETRISGTLTFQSEYTGELKTVTIKPFRMKSNDRWIDIVDEAVYNNRPSEDPTDMWANVEDDLCEDYVDEMLPEDQTIQLTLNQEGA